MMNKHELPFFLPDIGTFFNSDLEKAKKLIDDVAKSGSFFLKGEILHDPEICLNGDFMEVISDPQGNRSQENYRMVINRKVVSLESYRELLTYAKNKNLRLVMSVYDFKGLEFCLDLQVDILKIASSNLVHKPLILEAGRSRQPVIMDTGKAHWFEIQRSVEWFLTEGQQEHLLMEYSPPGPFTPVEYQDLQQLKRYQETFKCPVGLSDHFIGNDMLYAAIALGADFVEKGVRPSELAKEQDVAHALSVDELGRTIQTCRNISLAVKPPQNPLKIETHPARMGLVSNRDLEIGKQLNFSDFHFAFPARGIPVENYEWAINRKVIKKIPKGSPILIDSVEA